MPVSRQRSDSSEMDVDAAPGGRLGDLSRGGSLESGSGSSRSRSFTLDDESLKYLTHEEKDVILFFEETIDSLEDDFEEQVLCDSGVHSHSPGSLDESTSSHSEPGDVINLVQPAPEEGGPECLPAGTEAAGAGPAGKEDSPVLECGKPEAQGPPSPDAKPEAQGPPSPDAEAPEAPPVAPSRPEAPPAPAPPRRELPAPAPPAEHPRLPRSVPTPLVMAQKMSEQLAGSDARSPAAATKEGRRGEWRTLPPGAPRTGARLPGHRPPAQPAPRAHRFPSNISVTNSAGKEFNRTISRAAVSVQERKARVLANIHGASFLSPGEPGSSGAAQAAAGPENAAVQAAARRSRGVQTDGAAPLANGLQRGPDALTSEPGASGPAAETGAFRPDPARSPARPRAGQSRSEHRPPGCGQDARTRAGSLPRAGGFRPQGVTVQFAGRGSTEEARREALRKLGLLKENL